MWALQGNGPGTEKRRRIWSRALTSKAGSRTDATSHAPGRKRQSRVASETAHGAPATGDLTDDTPLLAHETERLAIIEAPDGATPRAILNGYFITQNGREELGRMLESGRYRIDAPEEAALPAVHWFLVNGETHRAYETLRAIAPFWDRIPFYPTPTDRARLSSRTLSLETAAETVRRLRAKKPSRQMAAMKETLVRWVPMYDRAVALFLSTVRGPIPRFGRNEDGTLARQANGQPVVEGGWPCQIFTRQWKGRAEALLADYERERSEHPLAKGPDRPKGNFARLRHYLQICIDDPKALTGRDVGVIRKILASFVSRHGTLGSPRLNRVRRAQARDAALPGPDVFAHVIAERIDRHAALGGLDTIADELGPITDAESQTTGLAVGTPIPKRVTSSARRCLEGTLDTLTEAGIISSAEVLAGLVPRLAGAAKANAIESPALRRLYEEAYAASHRRRTIAPIEDLPWITAMEPSLTSNYASRYVSYETLRELARTALVSFPQTITPNALVNELRTLVAAAELPLRLTNTFTAGTGACRFDENHLLSARQAIPVISDTLYHRYYGLPLDALASLDDVTRGDERAASHSPGYTELCRQLAGVDDDTPPIAQNRATIEQSQILTTHNLAHLVNGLKLTDELALTSLASECFAWICRTLQTVPGSERQRLRAVSNAAHAWRQMVFFLAVAPAGTLSSFLDWAIAHLAEQPGDLPSRFAPAMEGLTLVATGGTLDADGTHGSGARRFVAGWATGDHWLLTGPERPDERTGSRTP